jgi:glutamate/tyrosine decarboxylase-like PLP-dependent enzyme
VTSNAESGRSSLELDAETMRRLGYRVVDLLVDRISGLDADVAWRGADRARLDALLDTRPPAGPRDFEVLLEKLRTDVFAYAARVDHPRFFAFVPGSPTWPGILGDFLAAGHNVFQGTWLGSAGPSALELVVLGWFRDWLEMPATAGGLFLSGGSVATLTAMACARQLRFGMHDASAMIYFSEETHSSVPRAARILGFSSAQLRPLPVDDAFRLQIDALRDAVAEDTEQGRIPFLVVANGGTTSTGSVDPLSPLSDFCRETGMWLHVDAAYGGFAVLTERGRRALNGIGRADSVTLDPHKWLYQPFETGCLLVRDGALLEQAFRTLPHYLQDTAVRGTTEAGRQHEVNFSDRGIQLTRSARAIKVWLSVQYFGLDAFRTAIDRTLDLARYAEHRIRADARFEVLSPSNLGVVCFRRVPDDAGETGTREARIEALNADLVKRLGSSGDGLISSTRLGGRYTMRICALNHRSRESDIDRVLDRLAGLA